MITLETNAIKCIKIIGGPSEYIILQPPEMPDKEDYTDEYSDDEPEFDEVGFNRAMQDYENEMGYSTINHSNWSISSYA